jgi:2-C-methyl-D-erythritol 4-phosphate cytidylyltransferase
MLSRYYGLIPAAGLGARLGASDPKQYADISGRPMLYYALAALLAEREIAGAFVILAPADKFFREHDWSAFGERVAPLYCGGATRRDSVFNGLIAAADELEPDDWVLVHDAARPCLATQDVRRLIDAVKDDEVGGILAMRVTDTLKRGDDEHRIVATEPREGLWQAQTPQMFRYGLLLRALRAAPHVSDEAAAVEAIGLMPRLVQGSIRNIKVTYESDLDLAALILHSQEGA